MSLPRFKTAFAAFAVSTLLASPVLAENEHVAPIQSLANEKVRTWMADPVVINAIKAQNAAHAALTQSDVDGLDKEWRAEVKAGSGKLTSKTLSNALSTYLKKVKAEGQGLYTEIFVMDDKGLNVGQSDVTSDYWQGDEAKWQKTYGSGSDQMHISKITIDESSQILQSQLSMTITDPASGKPIGAITVGINVEQLGQ